MNDIDIEIGQVLWLIIRYNNTGTISDKVHPYLVMGINEEFGYIEIAQLDSLEGKEYKAAKKTNHVIYYRNPTESVITKDAYIQLDNTFRIESFPGLSKFRRIKGKLSEDKRNKAIEKYYTYHENNIISENKNVYMNKEEILLLNRPKYY